MIALLGARDSPVDGVEDYCNFLRDALAQCGQSMEVLRVPWAEKGWWRGLYWLWRQAGAWRGRWVFVQYTALNWSRRGLSLPALAVLAILKLRRARCAVVYHDDVPYGGTRLTNRIRTSVQTFVMRSLCREADLVVTTIPPGSLAWMPHRHSKIVCIPVGANLPTHAPPCASTRTSEDRRKTVAIFSIAGGAAGTTELDYIARTVAGTARSVDGLRLAVLGRNSENAVASLRQALDQHNVETIASGLLPAEEIAQRLAAADVLLFVRGGISSRRGSAIAAIVCGVPVVAFSNRETAPPLTEAGVVLAPEGNCEALSEALLRVLTDDTLRVELRQKNLRARELYFSWTAIARAYLRAVMDVRFERETK